MPSENGYESALILRSTEIDTKLRRLAFQILERHPDEKLYFIGIHTRGVVIAERLRQLLEVELGELPMGTLDISLYRDDLDNLGTMPALKGTDLPASVDGASIVLVDDVLFTGRTVNAAIDALTDYGRPKSIELAVLIDRGNRELPITANYVGHTMSTSREDYIRVRLKEQDEGEGIYLLTKKANGAS